MKRQTAGRQNEIVQFFHLAIALLLACPVVQAQSAPQQPGPDRYCDFGVLAQIKRTRPSATPNYFFRTFDYQGKEYVSYATESDLRVLTLADGREYAFAGAYDPVPMGPHIMSTPNEDYDAAGNPTSWGMHFYSLDDILKGQARPAAMPVSNQVTLPGTYQSVGLVSRDDKGEHYRILTDQGQAEYLVDSAVPPHITQIRPTVAICPNISFRLPMISKDGSLLSGYDVTDNKTKIWKVNPDGGNCDLVLDLGIGVSKADFSYSGTQIAFHTSSVPGIQTRPAKTGLNGAAVQEYIATPDGSENMNVYVYDLQKHTLKKMTQNLPGQNYYFPVWRPDDTLVLSAVSTSDPPAFVHLDPRQVTGTPFEARDLNRPGAEKLFLLGQLWSQVCLSASTDRAQAVGTALSLDPQKCQRLAREAWDQYKSKLSQGRPNSREVSGLSAEDLALACPKQTVSVGRLSTDREVNSEKRLSGATQILARKCSICHDSWFSVENLRSGILDRQLQDKIFQRINTTGAGRMPRNSVLTEGEKKELNAFLRVKK